MLKSIFYKKYHYNIYRNNKFDLNLEINNIALF